MNKSQVMKELTRKPSFAGKVWLACMEIPEGETRTYKWVAQRIGSPRAARAVGNALAKNPFAPVVPCHRVIRSDGTPGGFSGRGGTGTKASLLARERRSTRGKTRGS